MRSIFGFICVLALGVIGCSETVGTGGSGGAAGADGDGGTGGEGGIGGVLGEPCVPAERTCESLEAIDPIQEMCEIIVPDQPSVCDGTASITNPMSCIASGNAVTHKLTKMQMVADCNAGYDLDGCDGRSCVSGGLAGGEGVSGVDNGLAVLAIHLRTSRGLNPSDLDQAFHDAICTGEIDLEIEVDLVPEENCAVVTISAGGVAGDPIPMNLSDDGCLSGTLGSIPIGFGETNGAIENALLRTTVSSRGLSDGILAGTADAALAVAMGDAAHEGFGTATIPQVLDINADLSGNSLVACDSLSMTLEIGGSAIP